MIFIFCSMSVDVLCSQSELGIIDSILTPRMVDSIIAKTEQILTRKILLRLCGSGFRDEVFSVQDYREALGSNRVCMRLDSKISISRGRIEPVTVWQKIIDSKNPAKNKYMFLFIGADCSPKITVDLSQEDEELFFRRIYEQRLEK